MKGYNEIADFLIKLGARISKVRCSSKIADGYKDTNCLFYVKKAFFHASHNGLLAVTAKMMTQRPEVRMFNDRELSALSYLDWIIGFMGCLHFGPERNCTNTDKRWSGF